MRDRLKKYLRALLSRLENAAVRLGVCATRILPDRTWLRIREDAQIVRELDYSRVPTRIVVDSWIEKDARLNSCKREPGTVQWIEEWFKPGDVFFDIGANVGAYSLIAFQFLLGQARIYAFEPGFMNYPQLCRNIFLNNAGKAIVPLQVALSDRTDLSEFHYQNLTTGGALHALGAPLNQHKEVFEPVFSQPVISYRVDEILRQFDLPVPNHVKIDVDGTEVQVLKGFGDVLGRQELKSFMLEADNEGDTIAMTEIMQMNGFVVQKRLKYYILFTRGDHT